MEIIRTLCDQCGKVISEKQVKTDKEKYLDFWGYTAGTPEAEAAWERKLEMHRNPIRAPQVIGDISPYISQIDGSVISSRSQHKTHLKDHGCVEVGNEKMDAPKTSWIEKKENKEALRREIGARLDSIS